MPTAQYKVWQLCVSGKVLKKYLIAEDVIHADETVVQVLKEDGKNLSSESRMWVYTSGKSKTPVVLFEYQPTRSGQHAKRFLEGFSGYLQSDDYSGYNAVPYVTHCGCWSHQKRKYEEALPKGVSTKDSKAAIGLEYCNKLFDLEKDRTELTNEERYKKRLEQSKPVLDAYWSWKSSLNVLQGSNLGKAITYSINQKTVLNAFLLYGGAEASATVYSIIETAKLNGLNPYMYLVHLLTELPNIKEATPEALKPFLPWNDALPKWCRNSND